MINEPNQFIPQTNKIQKLKAQKWTWQNDCNPKLPWDFHYNHSSQQNKKLQQAGHGKCKFTRSIQSLLNQVICRNLELTKQLSRENWLPNFTFNLKVNCTTQGWLETVVNIRNGNSKKDEEPIDICQLFYSVSNRKTGLCLRSQPLKCGQRQKNE